MPGADKPVLEVVEAALGNSYLWECIHDQQLLQVSFFLVKCTVVAIILQEVL